MSNYFSWINHQEYLVIIGFTLDKFSCVDCCSLCITDVSASLSHIVMKRNWWQVVWMCLLIIFTIVIVEGLCFFHANMGHMIYFKVCFTCHSFPMVLNSYKIVSFFFFIFLLAWDFSCQSPNKPLFISFVTLNCFSFCDQGNTQWGWQNAKCTHDVLLLKDTTFIFIYKTA